MATTNRPLAVLLLLSLLSFPAAAQVARPLFFGDYAPLTNTRYGTIAGSPQLVSNGREMLLFWGAGTTLRSVRLADGERRVAQVALEPETADAAAVAWTGQHFFAVSYNNRFENDLIGRLLDANGLPAGAPLVQLPASVVKPRVASNGARIVVLTAIGGQGTVATVLSADGRQVLQTVTLHDGLPYDMDIASNGHNFAIVLANVDAARVLILDRNGSLVLHTTAASGFVQRSVAIASAGLNYLVAWADDGLQTAAVSQNGTAAAPLTVEAADGRHADDVALTWAGDHYALAYRSSAEWFQGPAEVRLYNVHGGNASAERVATLPATVASRVSLGHLGGRTQIAWNPDATGIIHVKYTDELTDGAPASYGASDQQILDSATSPLATLFVWSEVADGITRLFTGLRNNDGHWSERQLGTNLDALAIATTNGSEYIVLARDNRDWLAYRLAAAGNTIGPPSRIAARDSMTINDIAWNGRDYVVTAIDKARRVIAAKLTAGGTLSTPAVVREPRDRIHLEKPLVVSDGTNTLLVWAEVEATPCFPICDFYRDGLNYRLLGPNLELLGESPRMIVDNDGLDASVLYAGGEYAVVWRQRLSLSSNEVDIHGTRIARDGRRVGPAFTIHHEAEAWPYDLRAVSLGDRYAVAWRQNQDWKSPALETRVAIVHPEGRVLGTAVLPRRIAGSSALVALSGDRLGYAIATQTAAAPHHGASRILLAIGSQLVPRQRPGPPPKLVATFEGAVATLSWAPASGEVNGYRVEYRVGDGAWNEVERWIGAQELTTTVRLPRTGSVAFRVRAFNDAGAGAYSPQSGTGQVRRRAVR